MSRHKVNERFRSRPGLKLTFVVLALVASLLLAACGSDDGDGVSGGGGSSASGDSKLILFQISFPCGLNEYATLLCEGVEAEADELGSDFDVQIKTGKDFGDNVAFNNLIQTSLQLNPDALVVFPVGPAAQTPVLNQACDRNTKVVIIDSAAEGVECQVAFVGADHHHLGVLVGEWLIENPPESKEVGVVSFPPGQTESMDQRVRGFTETVEEAGFELAASVTTDLSLDQTRTKVTNMLTANPDLGAVFSANSPIAQGAVQALKGKDGILHLTVDGASEDVERILDGTIAAVAAQDPFAMGRLAVRFAAQAIEGDEVPETTYTPDELIDEDGAQGFLEDGGLRGKGI